MEKTGYNHEATQMFEAIGLNRKEHIDFLNEITSLYIEGMKDSEFVEYIEDLINERPETRRKIAFVAMTFILRNIKEAYQKTIQEDLMQNLIDNIGEIPRA